MKLLEKENYHKVVEPLKRVTFNKFFACSVIKNHVSGSVYVDNMDNPKTFYIVHAYGMSLLFGDYNNKEFNTCFRDYALNTNQIRHDYVWMQVFPDEWNFTLSNLLGDHIMRSNNNSENVRNNIIELNTRINFQFILDNYLEFKRKNIKNAFKTVRTDEKMFAEMKGTVVPLNFWDNADDFIKNGIGFSLYHDNILATTAFSSFVHDNKLELGMETLDMYQGNGYALYTCSVLIDYCIENGFEPVWACRLENTASYKLAIKLGFEPVKSLPYYRLCR